MTPERLHVVSQRGAQQKVVRSEMLDILNDPTTRAALLDYPGEGILGMVGGVAVAVGGAIADVGVAAGKVVYNGLVFYGAAAGTAIQIIACGGDPGCTASALFRGVGVTFEAGDAATQAVIDLANALVQRAFQAQAVITTYSIVKVLKFDTCAQHTRYAAEWPDDPNAREAMRSSCERAAYY